MHQVHRLAYPYEARVTEFTRPAASRELPADEIAKLSHPYVVSLTPALKLTLPRLQFAREKDALSQFASGI